MNNFGPYQDFVKQGEYFMYHSILSSSINIGLLNPIDIIEELTKYKSKVKINSFEGYIRQLFWREYQRYCYIYAAADFKKNYFGGFINEKDKGNTKSVNKIQRNGLELDINIGIKIFNPDNLNGWYFSFQNLITAGISYRQGLFDLIFRGNNNIKNEIDEYYDFLNSENYNVCKGDNFKKTFWVNSFE